jgi:hypothetical protein
LRANASAQEIDDSNLPVSLRHGTALIGPPDLGADGTWIGALTKLKCSQVALLPGNSGFSVTKQKLRIETIEFRRKKHEPSVLVIATKLKEQRVLDPTGKASLEGLKAGRYVLAVHEAKKEAIGTVDIPNEPARCVDEIPVVEADGYWAIGSPEKKID